MSYFLMQSKLPLSFYQHSEDLCVPMKMKFPADRFFKVFALMLVTFNLIFSTSFSQSAEVGIFVGTTTYKGDLHNSLFNPDFLKPAVGILYRKNMNNHWAHRFGLNYGRIEADDATSDDQYKKNRNLNFQSSIWDLHYYLEFNFFKYQIANPNTRFSPFIF